MEGQCDFGSITNRFVDKNTLRIYIYIVIEIYTALRPCNTQFFKESFYLALNPKKLDLTSLKMFLIKNKTSVHIRRQLQIYPDT